MSAYRQFASIYDKINHDLFSKKMFRYTQRILTRLRYRPKTVLDLACGTGTAAILWAKQNARTWGIDGSRHMLETARTKAAEAGEKVAFSCQPMDSFAIDANVDLVTCYFDSINYILEAHEVADCFRCVHRTLHPNGLFIFDFNTPEAMKTLWDDQVYAEVSDDIAWIWKNIYFPKAKQAEVRATFFVRQGKRWERFDELHTERGYTATEMRRLLKATGFKVEYLYECLKFTKPDRKSTRIAIVARKK